MDPSPNARAATEASATEPGLPRPVRLGRGICGDLLGAARREWLVTNGIGGYAMGSLAGLATRRYHGPLVAALVPPTDRTVLVGGLLEWAAIDDDRFALHAVERADGSIDGRGWERLESFELDGSIPAWWYAAGDVRVVRRLWMADGANLTYVRYAVEGADREVTLELSPLTVARDHHVLRPRVRVEPRIEPLPGAEAWPVAVNVAHRDAPASVMVLADGGAYDPHGGWIRGVLHREEAARGQDARSTLHRSGTLRARIAPGWPLTVALLAVPVAAPGRAPHRHSGGPRTAADVAPGDVALAAERRRRAALVARGRAVAAGDGRTVVERAADPFRDALVLAADAFLVDRAIPGRTPADPATPGRTVIAGYPWFNDWGRDTMIALAGLTLPTGRADEGATILRSFARFVRDGLVPNMFPDHAADEVAYHTIDASLWYPIAVERHRLATGDEALVDELLPTVRAIVGAHRAGTRFGIGVDPADGLVRGGAEGYQLTWMDARLDDWVVTPRRGKPVEIQALWVNALRILGDWLAARGEGTAADGLRVEADRATAAFRSRFWRPGLGHLLDVVDGPDGDDASLRPNQLLAIALPHPLLDPAGAEARAVLDAAGRSLVTSLGLRSLGPAEPGYRGRHRGDRRARDGAYHQGTVWAWLIGPYLDAVLAVTGDRAAVRSALAPFADHLADAGLGSISETFDGDPPHDPTGCIAQAWSVAELLRVLDRLERRGPGRAVSRGRG